MRSNGEPIESDEKLLDERLAEIDRKAYMRGSTSRDGLRPLWVSQSPTAGSARFSEEVDRSRNASSRKLI